MEQIAFIVGETFLYWEPIVLTLAAITTIFLFLAFYLWDGGKGLGACLAVPLGVLLSMVLGRMIHWYCRADSYINFYHALTDYSVGGYALLGVFAGCFLTGCILRGLGAVRNLPQFFDSVGMAGAAGIAVGRLGCLYTGADRGEILQAVTQMPLAYPVFNTVTGQTEYRLATFLLQAMAAGGIFLLLLGFRLVCRHRRRPGDICFMFLLLYGSSQIVLDSTRYDSLFLRSNGFISIVQIAGAAAVVLAVVVFSIRLVRRARWRWWYCLLWTAILGLLGGVGYMEYYVQRHGDRALFAYTVMSICLLLVIVLVSTIYILSARTELDSPTRLGADTECLN